jgi:hypothetical protein
MEVFFFAPGYLSDLSGVRMTDGFYFVFYLRSHSGLALKGGNVWRTDSDRWWSLYQEGGFLSFSDRLIDA